MTFVYEIPSYDFPENTAVRGPGENTFRWFEPALPPEINLDSTLEAQSFETAELGTWSFYGTGGFFVASSGTLVPYGEEAAATFYAFDDDYSLCLSPTSVQSSPINTPILSGDWGSVDHIDNEVLLRSPAVTPSTTVGVRFTARKWGDAELYVVAVDAVGNYYDPDSNSWSTLDEARTGSWIPAVGDRRTFTVAFPAATTRVDFRVVGSGYVELDNITIADASSTSVFGYSVPSGYKLQITPDLGWGDPLAMFNERTDLGLYNHQLWEYSGSWEELDDGSAKFVISAQQFLQACPAEGTYLWRVVPMNSAGNWGVGGLPQAFDYVEVISDAEFYVKPFVYRPGVLEQRLDGVRPEGATIAVSGLPVYDVLYPGNREFAIVFPMDQAYPSVTITCRYLSTEHSQVVDLEFPDSPQSVDYWDSPLDNWGNFLGRERQPGESNVSFKKRLRAVASVRGTTRKAVATALAAALGVEPTTIARIKAPSDVEVAVTQSYLKFYSSAFAKSTRIYLEPFLGYAEVNGEIQRVISAKYQGKDVEVKVDGNRLKFETPYVDIVYEYTWRIALDSTPIAAVSLPDQVSLEFLYHGTEVLFGLLPMERQAANGAELQWAPIGVINPFSEAVRDAFKTAHLDYWNTRYEAWVKQAQTAAFPVFGAVRFDRDYWDPPTPEVPTFEPLPTLADSRLAYYYDGKREYDEWTAWWLNFRGYYGRMGYVGVSPADIISGVGGATDLSPGLRTEKFTAKTTFRRRLSAI